MCEHKFDPNDPFADLDDSDFENEPVRETRNTSTHVEQIGNVEVPGFVENCPKCNGTGVFRGYTGMQVGRCFKCKGKGKLAFKTAPEARAKARKYAAHRKVVKAQESREALLESLDPDVREWLLTNEGKNRFATDLLDKGAKYNGLTDGQIAGVRKCIAKDADRAAGVQEWAKQNEAEYAWMTTEADDGNEFAASLLEKLQIWGNLTDGQLRAVQRNLAKEGSSTPSDIDLSGLVLHKTGGGAERSYFAVPDGDTRLKLCVRRPGTQSRFHGWTFVDDGAAYGSRRTYGKQAPDGTYRGDVQDALRAILADPKAAAIAYGKLTGTCGVCGRVLEDEESVAAGIGPVCAEKF